MSGVDLTASGILNLWEKNEKIKSMVNWVIKLIKIKSPKSV